MQVGLVPVLYSRTSPEIQHNTIMLNREVLKERGNIANVVLQGVNRTNDPKIYDIGMDIVKKISKNGQRMEDYNHITTKPAYDGAPVKQLHIPKK